MRKVPLLLMILILILAASCSFQPFKEVRIIGNPQLVIPLGERSSLIGEQFDIQEELQTQIAGQEGLDLIDTANISDPGIQAFVDSLPAADPLVLEFRKDMVNLGQDSIPLDDLGLDSLNQVIDPVTMNVPDLNIPAQTSTAGMDNIPLPIVSVGAINLPTLPESSAPTSVSVPTQTVTVTGYTTVTFDAGSMVMTITSTPATPTLEVTVNATITTAGNTLTATAPVTITGSGSADLTFPLVNETLGNTMNVDFSVSAVNGTIGQSFSLSMATDFSAGTTLTSATGVDFSTTESDTVAIPFDLSDPTLRSLTIGTGSLVLDGPVLPASWSGVSTTVDLDLLVNGASAATGTGSLDLATVTLANGDTVTLNYTVNVTGTNAAISVSPGVDEFSFTATPTITELSSIELDATDMDFSINQSIPLDPSITDLVSSVTFIDPGLRIQLDNQLPSDLTVRLRSDVLLGTGVLVENDFTTGSLGNWDTAILSPDGNLTTGVGDIIDIALDVTMPGYNGAATPPTLTLANMTPGSTYSLSGSIELYSTTPDTALQLESAVIKTISPPLSDQFPAAVDPGIDFASTLSGLDDVLPSSAQFLGIDAYLNVDVSAFTGTAGSIDLYLSMDYNIGGVAQPTEDLVGSSGTPVSLTGATRIDFPAGLFDSLINDRATDIYINYILSATGATVDLTGTSQGLQVSAVALIPIQMEFTAPYDLVDELGDPFIPTATEDLFGRDGTVNDDDINDWLAMATAASINLNLENTFLQTNEVNGTLFSFTITDTVYDPLTTPFSKTFEINGSNLEIALTGAEIAAIIDPLSYPFVPSYTLTLPAAIYSVSNGDIDLLSGTLSVESDIDYTIEVGGNK